MPTSNVPSVTTSGVVAALSGCGCSVPLKVSFDAGGGEAGDGDGAGVPAGVEAPAAVRRIAAVLSHDDGADGLVVADGVGAGAVTPCSISEMVFTELLVLMFTPALPVKSTSEPLIDQAL